jgi:putative membrane protein insertion efficiency factor
LSSREETRYDTSMQKLLLFARRGLRLLFTLPIILYQYMISPFIPGACIYTPTCSHYARQSILRHGVLKGLVLGITRVFRCAGGLFTGGDDPVPEVFSFRDIGEKYRHFRAPRRRRKPGSSGR